MSYDLAIHVKVEGCDKYAMIAEPEYSNPTYNLGGLFRACMKWNYSQSEKDVDGNYQTRYYRCDSVIKYVERGLKELHTNGKAYTHLLPSNGWGTMSGAINALESLRTCIYEQAEEIPLECLYMSW